MPYRITNTTKKPKGQGRHKMGYVLTVGERTIYHGSSALVADDAWIMMEKKMTELAAVGDVRVEILGSSKTPENVKTLEALVSEERQKAQERAAAIAAASAPKGRVTQTGYENAPKAQGYDPNVEEDDLPFADEVNPTDPDAVATNDNFTVTAKAEGSGKKRNKG